MALGKHLFSFRTQKLSPVAAIILRKWETSTVPNYKRDVRKGVFFRFRATSTELKNVFKTLLLLGVLPPMLVGTNLKNKKVTLMKISVLYVSEEFQIDIHN